MGMKIDKLKQLLREKIDATDEELEKIVLRIDHKSDSSITWTEFLTFLSNEGHRRELIGDA